MSIYVPLTLMLMFSTLVSAGQVSRWYSAELVEQGQQLFRDKCAACHGNNAEGVPDWRRANEEGDYPPPPLDGGAYAWRFSLEQLREHIQVGEQVEDCERPSMQVRFTTDETDAVIAYFQSKWPERIYQAWQSKQVLSATQDDYAEEEAKQHSSTRWLKQHLSGARILHGEPKKTPAKGLTEIKVSGKYFYLTEGGRYAVIGNLIDLKTGRNVTRLNQDIETRQLISEYPVKDMIIYPAIGQERTHLTIFTDTSCPYCLRMHREVPKLRTEGVTVRFVPYPRQGLEGKGYEDLSSIWCAEHPREAMEEYVESQVVMAINDQCDRPNALAAGYELGNAVGLKGTPLLIMRNGERIRGYKNADDVLSRIGLNR